MDVTLRLEQIVLDIERTREPILIVGENLCNAVRTKWNHSTDEISHDNSLP